MIYFWVSTIKKPETVFIHGVLVQFKYALWAGLCWQMMSLVISVTLQHPSDRRVTGQIQFDRLFSYIVAFTGVFWVTANYGDRVYAIYHDQPFVLATDVACLLIVWLGLFISHYLGRRITLMILLDHTARERPACDHPYPNAINVLFRSRIRACADLCSVKPDSYTQVAS